MNLKYLKGIYIFFILSETLIAQKKEFFLNDSLQYIPENQFNMPYDSWEHYKFKIEVDTAIFNIKVKRITRGKLSNTEYQSFENELKKLSSHIDNKNDFIIINYYHSFLDPCLNTTPARDSYRSRVMKRFSRIMNKTDSIVQIFMYDSPENITKYGTKLKWIPDSSDFIKKNFLPIPYPCGSFVIIDRHGNYYIRKGEYSYSGLLKLLRSKGQIFETE